MLKERHQGAVVQTVTCCMRDISTPGCRISTHVFKITDVHHLAGQEPYLQTRSMLPTHVPIVGLDCEMAYTTAGMELIRLILVDIEGNLLLDQLVLPRNEVLDLNTQFSGVATLNATVPNTLDLKSARAKVCDIIGEETTVLGHGLENDFNALRLVSLQHSRYRTCICNQLIFDSEI